MRFRRAMAGGTVNFSLFLNVLRRFLCPARGGLAASGRLLPVCSSGLVCLVLFISGLFAQIAAAQPLTVTGYRIVGDAARARLVIHFDHEPEPNWFLLRGPHRLVIDLPETTLSIAPGDLNAKGLISGVRYGGIGEGKTRLILTGKGPFEVEKLQVLSNEAEPGYRLMADIVTATEQEFEAALALQVETTGATEALPAGERVNNDAAVEKRRFTIVLDPGHGGIDGGAEGVKGTTEKSITLAFAQELKAKLEAADKYDVFMTRDKDEFLRLDERVRIARRHQADLLISIHADAIRRRDIRGATVYTESEKASDAQAKATADRENLADELAGIEVAQEDHEVSDILVDLIRRETRGFSIRFARSLVGELSGSTEMINNPHRSAGFRVLKAPDVPSVLVELGYLSNPDDEEQLLDTSWRSKVIDGIALAIDSYSSARMVAGH